jgi:hypothetical protein
MMQSHRFLVVLRWNNRAFRNEADASFAFARCGRADFQSCECREVTRWRSV